jgi:hypothetical protein
LDFLVIAFFLIIPYNPTSLFFIPKVERYGERKGEDYYISSLRENAQTFAQKIRPVRKIET